MSKPHGINDDHATVIASAIRGYIDGRNGFRNPLPADITSSLLAWASNIETDNANNADWAAVPWLSCLPYTQPPCVDSPGRFAAYIAALFICNNHAFDFITESEDVALANILDTTGY